MPISEAALAKIISGPARQLCTPAAEQRNARPTQSVKESYRPLPPPSADDYSGFDDEYLGGSDKSYMMQENANPYAPRKVSNSQSIDDYEDDSIERSTMPENIKKSLLEQKINRQALNPDAMSVLDRLGIEEEVTPQRTIIPEQSPRTGNIDYGVIKAIFNECLREYFKNNKPLNESATLKTIGLSEGKIKLVDNKGNVFVSKLEYKGNVNENKK